MMSLRIPPLLLAVWLMAPWLTAADRATVIVVTGAPGTAAYQALFTQWASHWKTAATQGDAVYYEIPSSPKQAAVLKNRLAAEKQSRQTPLWLVLIGHGTFDGKSAKFNLHGPDLTAAELKTWLNNYSRPVAVINCASSSAPFINALSGTNRVILTATRSGAERNFCRLGGYLARAISSPNYDLDKDGQTSLLEAWLIASRQTAEFYKNENRLTPEHSLLDDNGDGKGTSPDWFRGTRITQKSDDPKLLPDGLRSHQFHLVPSAAERKLPIDQRARRDVLGLQLATLRARKSKMSKDEYYKELETILRELAAIYHPSTSNP